MNNFRWLLLAATFAATLNSGCAASRIWETAQFAIPVSADAFAKAQSNPLNQVEAAYARAAELEQQGAAESVDAYLRCAELLWPTVAALSKESDYNQTREAQLYQSAVGKLVETAQRFGRFNPTDGILLSPAAGGAGASTLPIRYHGFVWQPHEFESLSVVGDYRTPDIIHPHRQAGLGVPLLVQHTTMRPFVYPNAKFAATALIRFEVEPTRNRPRPVLDIVNPETIRSMRLINHTAPVAFDLTAPLAYYSVNEDRKWLTGFVTPAEVSPASGLSMMKPYQPGKIPVIFIHGLASDPMTWAAMGNELFLNQDLLDRYQFWIFSYPTGKPFPGEAAKLRRQLVELRNQVDPMRQDPALDQIVLIGHSMGGLISKLQISSSEDRLSRSILKVPLNQLNMSPAMRDEFTRLFFFEPSQQVSRVIFIGAPHRGSELAAGSLGQFASRLVQHGEEADQCTQFIQQNPDAFVVPMNRVPTSVDLLRPDSLMLQAIYGLPVNPRVRMHSIIGVGYSTTSQGEQGDGVVAVSSARHPNVESEIFVEADHDLHQHPRTIIEVVRLLREHASLGSAASPPHDLADHLHSHSH